MNKSGWLRRHSSVLVAFAAMLWFAPVGFVALVALLLLSPPIRGGATAATIIAGGVCFWWLTLPGVLPDQVMRAGIVLAVAAFLPITFFTRATLGHRILAASIAATLGLILLLGALGRSWQEMHWWTEHRVGFTMRMFTSAALGIDSTGTIDTQQLAEFSKTLVQFMADYGPALTVLQIMAGLALASAIYYKLAHTPKGIEPGRFRDFTFTEHLGWAAIVMLVVVLVPKLAAAKLGAMNALLVLGSLFALRGAAVATVGFLALGGGCLTTVLALATAFLLLPLALIGAILLGIVDTRFDLRRRWGTPPAGG